MGNKKIWLLFVSLIISFFVVGKPVKAEGSNPLDSAIPLSLNQTMKGSFDKTALSYHYYRIELSEKTGITVYGNNTGERGISLELQDANGKYVSHQSQAISANTDYKWRTKEVDPGIYYIVVSSSYAKIDYDISYSLELYPVCTELPQGTKKECVAGDNVFKINILSSGEITIYGDKNSDKKVDIKVVDTKGNSISCSSANSVSANKYKYRTKQLNPGIYYIVSSSGQNYTINYGNEIFPEAIALDRGNTLSGSLNTSNSMDVYKINLTEKQSITYFVNKDNSSYISLYLYDSEGNRIDNMNPLTEELSFKWSPEKELSTGTYYLGVSKHTDAVNYNIFWQVKGPSMIDDLTMTKATKKTITLGWTAPDKASKYKIFK